MAFCLSIHRGLGAGEHDQAGEENRGEGRHVRPIPRNPAQLHESHPCCQHQLRGVRVHEIRPRHFQVKTPRVYACFYVCLCVWVGGCARVLCV